jgi:single-stranded DNA-binding protein
MASTNCLGKTADIIEKFVTKGKEIAIEGKLTRSYDKNGEKRYVTEGSRNRSPRESK